MITALLIKVAHTERNILTMAVIKRPSGPRCPGCGRVFQPRALRDGSMSQSCGQTSCVALINRRKDLYLDRKPGPRNPRLRTQNT